MSLAETLNGLEPGNVIEFPGPWAVFGENMVLKHTKKAAVGDNLTLNFELWWFEQHISNMLAVIWADGSVKWHTRDLD